MARLIVILVLASGAGFGIYWLFWLDGIRKVDEFIKTRIRRVFTIKFWKELPYVGLGAFFLLIIGILAIIASKS